MKFAYVDESGSHAEDDVFVMAGLLFDAHRLRKYTATFDRMITEFLATHPSAPEELKTKAITGGTHGWSKVDPTERKQFVTDVCDLATQCATVFAIGFSFKKFEEAINAGYGHTFGKSYWIGAAMFVAALVQKMQVLKKNKGHTVLICDDNKHEMQNLPDAIYIADPWFDLIYQEAENKKGTTVWKEVLAVKRFDNIINSAFAIKSQHSSLIQVADAVAYTNRRNLELMTYAEAWDGEKDYFKELVDKLEPNRERLGRKPWWKLH